MFRNYIKTAFRNLKKQKTYSFINIMGLAVGLCCCILIFLYVAGELAYDNFHSQEDSIFRVMTSFLEQDGSIRSRGPSVPAGMAPFLKESFPEMKHVIRFARGTATMRSDSVLSNEIFTFTDPSVLNVFSFPLLEGNPESVLLDDHSIVLTRKMAAKYFQGRNPMGQSLTVTFSDRKKDFTVTGVVENPPRNSTIQFDLLIRIENLPLATYKEALTALGDFSYPLYVQLEAGVQPEQLVPRWDPFVSKTFASQFPYWQKNESPSKPKNPITFDLQRLRAMHFDTRSWDGTNPAAAYTLGAIALIVLVIACINFINLSIGRAAVRAREIGMRKVIGASRRQLIFQFWSESFLLVFIALVVGIMLSVIVMPTFNRLADKHLILGDFISVVSVMGMVSLLLFVAGAAGSYPALVMSRPQPVQIFRGRAGTGHRRILAKALVVIQFTLSVFLIVSTLVLTKQVRYMTEKNPGYAREGLVSIRTQMRDTLSAQRVVDLFRDKVRNHPGVLNVSAASVSFGRGSSRYPLEHNRQRIHVYQFRVDHNYIPTVGLKLIQGRNFDRKRTADEEAAIVNREFCRKLGITDPVGHVIGEFTEGAGKGYPYNLEIIGVVEDFHVLSFKQRVMPTLLHMQPGWGLGNMLVRISGAGISESMALLEDTWKSIQPDKPFVFSFTEDDLESQYATEKKWSGIITYSSLFAVLIACMGIFGLTSLAVSRRFKEIGIRKVLGASAGQIYSLVTREFVILVAAANLAAWPIAHITMHRVLGGYSYRIELGPRFFLTAGILSLLIALLTTSSLAVRAALSDPVRSIRHE